MQTYQSLSFGPYRLDLHTRQLWRGKQEVRLTLKAAAVLCYLLERAGQVATKDELFATVWSDTVVSDAALTSCIQELRRALHDDARKPRYLETVHRRGFRFIRKVVGRQEEVASSQYSVASSPSPPPTSNTQLPEPTLVGRETELTQLHGWFAKAVNGERQLVFVTGEPGIGKTTLIENFVFGVQEGWEFGVKKRPGSTVQSLKSLNTDPRPLTPDPWISRGQCIEHYGAGEAYLPILEALGRLCREQSGKAIIALLRQHAPSWVVQIPALLSPAELEELQRRTAGVTRERMLRELAEALEVITVERPLVLVLEDLHWSDVSTLDLLSMLAHRQEHARLLILGSYRPVEVLTRDHPLKGIKQELQLHGQCEELALDFLSETAVAEYLAVRFSVGATDRSPLQNLAHAIHQRTDGNPLFMVNVTNELVAHEVVINHDGHWEIKDKIADDGIRVPENLRQLIEQQLARVNPDERNVLEAASVAGAEFSAVAVAAGIEQSAEAVETHCDGLVRREQFLRTSGTAEWPDGTIAARYGFVHALYQEVLYEQISTTRRSRLHRQIGGCEEQAYGDRVREIAVELAVHFERGHDYQRAIQYLQQAGETAVRRSAYQEASTLLTRGLELLKTLPDTPERSRQELALQIALNDALIPIKGYIAPEVEKTLTRARALCQQIGEPSHLFQVLWRRCLFYFNQWEFQTTRKLAEQMLQLAPSTQDRYFLSIAHICTGGVLYWRGELPSARTYFEQGIALYDPQQHPHSTLHTADLRVDGLCYSASALWYLGYPDQALKRIHEALTLAQELAHPYSQAFAFDWAGRVHQHRREGQAAQKWAEAEIALATEQGFPFWLAGGTRMRGWALVDQGQLHEGITQMGKSHISSYSLSLLAEAHGKASQTEEGLTVLAEALARIEKTRERVYEAEMYRLKGELTLAQSSVQSLESGVQKSQKPALSLVEGAKGKNQNSENPNPQSQSPDPHSEAEACFLKAIDIAQKQQAKSLELRATTSLARLWQQQGKTKQAHKKLVKIYHWFTEGFDTKDLQEAKALLEELGH